MLYLFQIAVGTSAISKLLQAVLGSHMQTYEETLQLTNRVKNVLLSDSRTQKWEKGTIEEKTKTALLDFFQNFVTKEERDYYKRNANLIVNPPTLEPNNLNIVDFYGFKSLDDEPLRIRPVYSDHNFGDARAKYQTFTVEIANKTIDEALAPNDIENIVITGIDANGKEYDFVFPTLVTGGWFGEDPEIMSIKIVVGVSITPGFPFYVYFSFGESASNTYFAYYVEK